MPRLEARRLVKRFGRRVVVKGVDIRVASGEIVGLLGPKRRRQNDLFPDDRRAASSRPRARSFSTSRDVTRLPSDQRALAGLTYLPQENSVFLKATVIDNLRLGLELQPLSKAEREENGPGAARGIRPGRSGRTGGRQPLGRRTATAGNLPGPDPPTEVSSARRAVHRDRSADHPRDPENPPPPQDPGHRHSALGSQRPRHVSDRRPGLYHRRRGDPGHRHPRPAGRQRERPGAVSGNGIPFRRRTQTRFRSASRNFKNHRPSRPRAGELPFSRNSAALRKNARRLITRIRVRHPNYPQVGREDKRNYSAVFPSFGVTSRPPGVSPGKRGRERDRWSTGRRTIRPEGRPRRPPSPELERTGIRRPSPSPDPEEGHDQEVE